MTKPIKYSEIFHSFQGEGKFTGISTSWIRFFLCNLQCDGFGQSDPTDPSTYILPYESFDVSSVQRVEDLPVWEYGCDSSYTWAKKFKHLMKNGTPQSICDELQSVLKHSTNPTGRFLHPMSEQWHHLAFTGGEPMLKQSQAAIVSILEEFDNRANYPKFVTVETNGTTPITAEMYDWIYNVHYHQFNNDWFWSCSPKLFTTSGEKREKAIKPDVVGEYANAFDHGQLKYVVNGSQETWNEVEEVTDMFRSAEVDWPVYIMSVGATKESQETDITANIAMEAMKRGYYFSGRLHCSTFGNLIGT